MYEYFPGNCWWSAMVNDPLGMGAEMTELDPACSGLGAERTVNAASRELRVFTIEDGGAEHCQLDLFSQATDYIHDWPADFSAAAG